MKKNDLYYFLNYGYENLENLKMFNYEKAYIQFINNHYIITKALLVDDFEKIYYFCKKYHLNIVIIELDNYLFSIVIMFKSDFNLN